MRITAIVGSVRKNSAGHQIGEWVAEQANFATSELTDVQLDVQYLEDFDLPQVTSEVVPMAQNKQYDDERVTRWSQVIDSSDAFLFITPEYNHSIPGTFKNAVDLLGSEWVGKAVGFVGYGFTMGARAVEHWRQIVSNFEMHDVRSQVGIDLATALDSDGKVVVPEGANAQLKGVVESIAKAAQKLEN